MTRNRFPWNAPAQRRAHLFVLPGPDAARPDEYGAAAAPVQRLFQGFLPWLAGNKMPTVEKRGQPCLLDEFLGESLDRRLVFRPMREKHVVSFPIVRIESHHHVSSRHCGCSDLINVSHSQ